MEPNSIDGYLDSYVPKNMERLIEHKKDGTLLEELERASDLTELFNANVLALFTNDKDSIAQVQQVVIDRRDNACVEFMQNLHEPLHAALKIAYTAKESDADAAREKYEQAVNYYPYDILNMIGSAEATDEHSREDVLRFRRQFMEGLLTMVADSPSVNVFSDENSNLFQGENRALAVRAHAKLRGVFNEKYHSQRQQLVNEIDKGRFPFKMIAKNNDVGHINSKQFIASMKTNHNLSDALALAHIPYNWVRTTLDTGDVVNALSYEDRKSEIEGVNERAGALILKRYLANLGRKFASIDGEIADLKTSNTSDEEKGVKRKTLEKEKKRMAAKWSWLAKKGDLPLAFEKFDADYKVSASLRDYETQLNMFMDAIVNRIIYDHPAQDVEKCLTFEEGQPTIEIDVEMLKSKMMEYGQEQHNDYIWDLDDDDPYKDEEYFPDDMESLDYQGVSLSGLWDLKESADKNHRLHKNMSSITKQLGEHCSDDVSWIGVTKDDVSIGDYVFEPISSRKRLLQEGVQMNHCVYSYLYPCLRGETSIVSVKDRETGSLLATMEVSQEEVDDNEFKHDMQQLYGVGNSGVPKEIRDAANIYMHRLDEQFGLELNDVLYENQNNNELDDLDLDEMANLQVVPFLTDAIYDAYLYLEEYLPDSISFTDLIERTPGLMNLFYESEIGHSIRSIEWFSSAFDIDKKAVVANREAWDVIGVNKSYNELLYTKRGVEANKQTLSTLNQLEPSEVEEKIGVSLTESLAMWPAASVSGYYFAHPEAKYFGVGKITQDQLEDFASRKDIPLATAKKWLAPNLADL